MTASSDQTPLETWLQDERRTAAANMMRCVSPTGLVRERSAFGQVIVPKPGSVIASPEFGDYDPEPDYFFHWLRDSAVIMDAVRELMLAGAIGAEGHGHFADFIRFSLSLDDVDREAAIAALGGIGESHRQFARPAAEIESIAADRVRTEARYNPDGTLDIIKWARPQLDGPALRALCLMRYWPLCPPDAPLRMQLQELIRRDLGFVRRHWREPSFDIWEEVLGAHYYTRLVHLGALSHGAVWLRSIGDADQAEANEQAVAALAPLLDGHWSESEGAYLSQVGDAERQDATPDIAVILGVLHADLPAGPHSVADPKVQATLARLEETFARLYPINQSTEGRRAPALGRYPGDRYFGGNPWYVAIFAAAEFYFRLAALKADGSLAAKGDAFLATARRHTPASGELSEQFDHASGRPVSARNLGWSYAALITAERARMRCLVGPSRSQSGVSGGSGSRSSTTD